MQSTVEGKPKTRGYLYRFDRWGPEFWRVMHAITFLYPDEPSVDDQTRMLTLFRIMPFVLPCSLCGMHFAEAITGKYQISEKVLASRENLSRWLVDVHNDVNRRIEKQTVQYERVKRFYTMDSDCPLRPLEVKADATAPYRTALIVVSLILVLAFAGIAALAFDRGQKRLLEVER